MTWGSRDGDYFCRPAPSLCQGLLYLPFDVLCLQADPAFPATANITLNLDLDGLVIRRAVADPALPFPPNDHFAPTALVCSSTAVAERDKFDKEALSLAGELIAEGSQDVFIGDGNNNQIGGEELAACCRGEEKLTPDLRAV